MKVVRRYSYPVLGYLSLLVAFALLGLFVAALAYRSAWAAATGVALGASLTVSVAAFREGAARLARSRREGGSWHHVSIWSEPLRRDQVDRYFVNYRSGPRRTKLTVAPRSSQTRTNRPVINMPSRLSA